MGCAFVAAADAAVEMPNLALASVVIPPLQKGGPVLPYYVAQGLWLPNPFVGYAVGASLGLNLTVWDYVFVQTELEGGFAHITSARTTPDPIDRASHHMPFGQAASTVHCSTSHQIPATTPSGVLRHSPLRSR